MLLSSSDNCEKLGNHDSDFNLEPCVISSINFEMTVSKYLVNYFEQESGPNLYCLNTCFIARI